MQANFELASELGPDDGNGGRRGRNKGGLNQTDESNHVSTRGQAVFVRPSNEIGAMAWDQRIIMKCKSFLHNICCCGKFGNSNNNDNVEKDGSKNNSQSGSGRGRGLNRSTNGGGGGNNNNNSNSGSQSLQYRLEATRKAKRRNYIKFILSCGLYDTTSRSSIGGDGGGTLGINPNQQLAMYLHWMFRVNFLFLFTVMCVLFFAWVIIFAAFITIAGTMDTECVKIGDKNFGLVNTRFADAFALSWTTFSTVGYGSTYPALGMEQNSSTNCFFITFICSLESLLGVLYSGFCGAILFGKVLRIQSHAQVLFSDPIVIRYGSGVSEGGIIHGRFDSTTGTTTAEKDYHNELDNNNNSASGNGNNKKKKIPFPVLEFRIVNRLFNDVGGEIMDATLNVVANVDANDADPTMMMISSDNGMISSGDISGKYSTLDSNASFQGSTNLGNMESESDMLHRLQRNRRHHDHHHETSFDSNSSSNRSSFFRSKFIDHIIGKTNSSIYEDPTTRLVSKRIFSKMMIEASEHPFFKRVWLARHILDDTSPILKPKIRRQIRRNGGGSWPDNLGDVTYETIRNSLQFNQILVSLNGVSNVSASDLYAQKIYDFVDVNVGYQFVNILYRDTDGVLKVDTDLLNDVREQRGGGGEPLIVEE